MTAPPGYAPTRNGITGTRPKAAIRRELADRINAAGRRAGVKLLGWQVRSLMATMTANDEAPTDAEITRSLMSAPWFPKPRRRHWRVGEGGGLRTRS
jgi:hypothetical protein